MLTAVSKINVNDSVSVPLPTTPGEGEDVSDLSQDINDILASFTTNKVSVAVACNEKRKAPRFRVKWYADILIDDQNTHRGFINDISTEGASIYLNSSPHLEKCTLNIHVPPLNSNRKPHIIEVYARNVYVVYDGEKQLFRAAFSFIRFHPESDQASLGERLTKHHSRIPEY